MSIRSAAQKAEDWLFDQPALIAFPIIAGATLGLVAIIMISIILLFGGGGPDCVQGTRAFTVESQEMVWHGKIRVPGVVKRTICVPEGALER